MEIPTIKFCQYNVNPDDTSDKEIECGEIANWRWPSMESEPEAYFCNNHYDRVKRYMMMQDLDHTVWLVPIIPIDLVANNWDIPTGTQLAFYKYENGKMVLSQVVTSDEQREIRRKRLELRRKYKDPSRKKSD